MRHGVRIAAALTLVGFAACGGEAGDGEDAGADTSRAAAAGADTACAALTAVPADSMSEAAEGLLTLTRREGSGPAAESGDTVRVHYLGCLTDGTKFDASYDRNQPFSFRLGAGRVIRGWDLGVVGMRPGGVRILRIPPEIGYGERGTPGGPIPPNATLLFRIERLGASAADSAATGAG